MSYLDPRRSRDRTGKDISSRTGFRNIASSCVGMASGTGNFLSTNCSSLGERVLEVGTLLPQDHTPHRGFIGKGPLPIFRPALGPPRLLTLR